MYQNGANDGGGDLHFRPGDLRGAMGDDDEDEEEEDGSSGGAGNNRGFSNDAKDYTFDESLTLACVSGQGFGNIGDNTTPARQIQLVTEFDKQFKTDPSKGRCTVDSKYCWKCEYKEENTLGKTNTFLDAFEDIRKSKKSKPLFLVVIEIHAWYVTYMMPRTHKVWTARMIYDHETVHDVSDIEFNIITDIRRTKVMSAALEKVGVNKDGMPHERNFKLELSIMKERRAQQENLIRIRDK